MICFFILTLIEKLGLCFSERHSLYSILTPKSTLSINEHPTYILYKKTIVYLINRNNTNKSLGPNNSNKR